ncbi:hypothetical protein THOM_2736 [Trachipleistophora hominis]|uniref:Uncharacterized protein n=1 Tax=Trachipleistophora hominis TaxID=72359 RepID=L7JSB3_TRAHO|nr:hypothetical protein THOM_2736 [Trachipleistophora hominis]
MLFLGAILHCVLCVMASNRDADQSLKEPLIKSDKDGNKSNTEIVKVDMHHAKGENQGAKPHWSKTLKREPARKHFSVTPVADPSGLKTNKQQDTTSQDVVDGSSSTPRTTDAENQEQSSSTAPSANPDTFDSPTNEKEAPVTSTNDDSNSDNPQYKHRNSSDEGSNAGCFGCFGRIFTSKSSKKGPGKISNGYVPVDREEQKLNNQRDSESTVNKETSTSRSPEEPHELQPSTSQSLSPTSSENTDFVDVNLAKKPLIESKSKEGEKK